MIDASTRVLAVIALGLAAISATQSLRAHRTLAAKAAAQTEVTENVQRWKENYMALGESVKKWEHDYRHESSVPDLMSLFAVADLEKYSFAVNTDAITLNKIEPVTQNGMPIGLTRVCLASNGSGDASALEIQAPTYQALFDGIKRLAQRTDISIGSITVKGDKAIPAANLGDFCVLLRK